MSNNNRDINHKSVGQFLLKTRKDLGLSRLSVAKSTGISANPIRRLELGDVDPKWSKVQRLVEEYNLTLTIGKTLYNPQT